MLLNDATLLLQAADEIRSLRRVNEILAAKVEMIDLFAQVLHTRPVERSIGMGEDVAWKLQRRAGAQRPLWNYAEHRRSIDGEFADDLQAALKAAGFAPSRLQPSELPAPDTIIDYGEGRIGPLFLHFMTEGQDAEHIAREAGFECRWRRMDEELDENDQIYVDYFEYGASSAEILPRWRPAEQLDIGWKLVGKHDTEDGPLALFIRPLSREA